MHRFTLSRLLPALAALSALAVPTRADATHPDDCPMDPSQPAPGLTRWPLWQRPANVQSFPEDILDVDPVPRVNVWNSFGEFQHGAPHYMHTGIDINAVYDSEAGFGDWAVVAADGYIWGTLNFNNDQCVDGYRCKLYLKSNDHRFVYYYAHLNLRPLPGGEFDSAVRAKINAANLYDDKDMPDATYAANSAVAAGEVLAGVGEFINDFAHLHFSIHDACQNYDGLSPLDFISPPGFVDDVEPEVISLDLVNGAAQSINPTDLCTDPITEDFDIIARVRDIWEAGSAFPGNEHLGVHRGTYRLTNLSTAAAPVEVDWYNFDKLPFTCAGPDRGADCPDQIGQDGFIEEVKLFFPDDQVGLQGGGAFLGHTFAAILFSLTSPFASHSKDYEGTPMKNFAVLNNEWGIDDGQIDIDALPEGLYQVVAEVYDQRGLRAARPLFFLNDQNGPTSFANLLVRDHNGDGEGNELDDGAIPSNIGGKPHWRSPSIKVGGSKPGDFDAVWDEVQVIDVQAGVPTKVYVRIENKGCDTVHGFDIKVGTTKASLISTNWFEIDAKSEPNIDIAPGEVEVVEFDWTPAVEHAGHNCMLAAVDSDEDPSKVPMFDISTLDVPTGEIVPYDSNLAQRNLTISNDADPFIFGNPFGSAVDLGIEFDCNGFPIEASGATVTLQLDYDADIEAAWARVPRVDFKTTGSTMYLTFAGCKIDLPPVTLPANTLIDAWLDVTLPVAYTGSWDIDLGARVNGVLRDGITVRHTQ